MTGVSTDRAMVRLAASRRTFLLSWRVYLAYLVLAMASQALGIIGGWPELPAVLVLAIAAGLWWFNRSQAVWIERDVNALRIRKRRWLPGRMRSHGEITHELSAQVEVTFDPSPISWWRSDRTLMVEQHRFAIYPESRDHAASLATTQRYCMNSASLEFVPE